FAARRSLPCLSGAFGPRPARGKPSPIRPSRRATLLGVTSRAGREAPRSAFGSRPARTRLTDCRSWHTVHVLLPTVRREAHWWVFLIDAAGRLRATAVPRRRVRRLA